MRRAMSILGSLLLAGCTGNSASEPLKRMVPEPLSIAKPTFIGQVPFAQLNTDNVKRQTVEPISPSAAEAISTGVPRMFAGHWLPAALPGKAAASTGSPALAVDGDRTTEWNPRAPILPGEPQWLALPLAKSATGTLAIAWHGHALHYQNYDYGRPRTYEVQSSKDSTDGSDGQWTTQNTVTDNMVRSRIDLLDAPGAQWVRLRFLGAWGGTLHNEPFLREVTVYERTTAGAPDVWAVFGDSTTSVGLDPSLTEVFAPTLAKRHPGYSPFLVSAGTGGDESGNAHDRLAVGLPTLPVGSVVGLCYGTNDAKRAVSIGEYTQNMQTAIDQIRAAGDQPIVAILPWSLNSAIASYADACKSLATSNGLPPGPDFYSYFKAHPEQLEVDKVHPNAQGIVAMQRLWAESSDFRYAPN